MAATDALTGLANRQAFEILLQQSLLDVTRTGYPLSTILFDIDLFKEVNDRHGHLAGDRVLSAIAQLGRDAVRENDIVARWGGEEFVILLRNCPLENAYRMAEKLRDAIAGHDFKLAHPPMTWRIRMNHGQFRGCRTCAGRIGKQFVRAGGQGALRSEGGGAQLR